MSRIGILLADLFSLSPFIVACVVAGLLAVVEFGAFMGLPLVVLVLLYVFWVTSDYFLEIVEHKALGRQEWPVFSLETLVARRNQVGIVFFALVLALAGGYAALRYRALDTLAGMLLGVALALFPASVALLAVTREFRAALNPLRVLAAAVGMGHAYLYCLAGAAVVFVLLGLAEARGGLWYFPLAYGLFLHACLIGRVVYARRTSLGVNAPRSPEALADRARAETVATRRSILTHAYGLAAHGNRRGALRHIDAYIATDEDTLEARLWILNELARWEDGHVARELGKGVIEYCERHGFVAEAARVRVICEHLNEREPPPDL
jgi:hypothetical protein